MNPIPIAPFLLLSVIPPLHGQILCQSPGQWAGQAFALKEGYGVTLYSDQGKKVARVAPPPTGKETAAPAGTLSFGGVPPVLPCHHGGTWAAARPLTSLPSKGLRWEICTFQQDQWCVEGELTLAPSERLRSVIALDQDRYLLVLAGGAAGWSSAQWQKWSPFQVFRKSGATLTLDTYVDADLSEQEKRAFGLELAMTMYTVQEDLLVFCAPVRAYLRVLDLTQRRLLRSRAFFGEQPKEQKPPSRMSSAMVLGMYPRPDGSVLFLTRSKGAWEARAQEEADRKGHAELITAAVRANRMDAISRIASESVELSLASNPELFWWELDPRTGQLDRLGIPPKGCIAYAFKAQEILSARYRPHLDGSLRPILGETAPSTRRKPGNPMAPTRRP